MISAILLAAGQSSRMGLANKLLLPYDGMPLIRHMVRQLSAAAIDELILVTGYEAERVLAELDGFSFHSVHNPNYPLGMTSSIQAGIRKADKLSKAYMIALADLPLLQTADYQLLIQAYWLHSPSSRPIQVPTYQEARGHPVIFDHSYRDELLAHQAPEGCKGIIKAHFEAVQYLKMPNNHILRDVDTPESYQAIL
ncbi:MAG: nucleotidyltransferase family protein [Bacteroidota bacterium]